MQRQRSELSDLLARIVVSSSRAVAVRVQTAIVVVIVIVGAMLYGAVESKISPPGRDVGTRKDPVRHRYAFAVRAAAFAACAETQRVICKSLLLGTGRVAGFASLS